MITEEKIEPADESQFSVILENPYLRSVVNELLYLDAWKSGLVSPISAALRVRQIRNANLVDTSPDLTRR